MTPLKLMGSTLEHNFAFMDGYEGGKQEARDAAHAEIDELKSERDALQAQLAAAQQVAQGQLDMWVKDGELIKELREQLAAAQGQEPVATVKAKSDAYGGTFVHWTVLPVAGMTLYATPLPQQVAEQAQAVPKLTVWFDAMPESNGKRNWTAMLCPVVDGQPDLEEGYTLMRSEYHGRTQYTADYMRWLIGERKERPCPTEYDDKSQESAAPQPKDMK